MQRLENSDLNKSLYIESDRLYTKKIKTFYNLKFSPVSHIGELFLKKQENFDFTFLKYLMNFCRIKPQDIFL